MYEDEYSNCMEAYGRVNKEITDLRTKRDKLIEFLNSKHTVSAIQQHLLAIQLQIMQAYIEILYLRLSQWDFPKKGETENEEC